MWTVWLCKNLGRKDFSIFQMFDGTDGPSRKTMGDYDGGRPGKPRGGPSCSRAEATPRSRQHTGPDAHWKPRGGPFCPGAEATPRSRQHSSPEATGEPRGGSSIRGVETTPSSGYQQQQGSSSGHGHREVPDRDPRPDGWRTAGAVLSTSQGQRRTAVCVSPLSTRRRAAWSEC